MIDTTFYNQQRSGYDELVSYGPYFYKNILEMNANYKFAGSTLDIMAEGLETIIRDELNGQQLLFGAKKMEQCQGEITTTERIRQKQLIRQFRVLA